MVYFLSVTVSMSEVQGHQDRGEGKYPSLWSGTVAVDFMCISLRMGCCPPCSFLPPFLLSFWKPSGKEEARVFPPKGFRLATGFSAQPPSRTLQARKGSSLRRALVPTPGPSTWRELRTNAWI